MLELDFLLLRFFDSGLADLSLDELKDFDLLLDESDPDLYAWLLGYDKPGQENFKLLINTIKAQI